MKSKLFGFSAKMALAILAVGTAFTSCYDSENGDVTKPYEPLPAAYYVAGSITDVETGMPLAATVTVNGEVAAVTDGNYSATGKVGENTVKVECEGYVTVERKATINEVAAGQSYTAVVSVAMSKETSNLDVDVKMSVVKETAKKPLYSKDNIGLDLIAEDEGAQFVRTFDVVTGYAIQNEFTASSELTEYINQYLGENIGEYGNLKYTKVDYTIDLAPWTCLTAVNVNYDIDVRTYEFTTTDETVTVKVKGVVAYSFTKETTPNHNYSHSHGHGHAHGEDLNAGGGILTPEM